jgi:hypothetical protein
MERKQVKIGEAAAPIGSTPACKTKGGTRYDADADLLALGDVDAPTICYAEFRDLGFGMNGRKKGHQKLLEMVIRRQMRRLVLETRPQL